MAQGMRALDRRRPMGRQGGGDRGRGCHQCYVLSGGDELAERPAKNELTEPPFMAAD